MSELTEMDRAIAAQSELADALSSVRGVNGIGVGAGRVPGTYALYVAVSDKRAAKSVPDSCSGLDVVVDVVGRVSHL
ncbi:hypothetical protein [Prosthecodimorpha staleyi]|uniref:Uncharacterized protein n=1 Tax=Prosthecodimorpha staleyi TaxID=2840188 RepID=A0A947D5V7_9HYPH|nr:hypothetical protein [Prosthecodimorpha staleyi]MBT9291436.1 hypothetical protein [Prosthecodimorpha staleyi]